MMDKSYNILVTGAGGDIGQSIGKILVSNKICKTLTGADIQLESAAKFIFTNFCILPSCNLNSYIDELEYLVNKNQIEIIIPASEQEIRFFTSDKEAYNKFEDKLILANLESREVGLDKMQTYLFLKSNKFEYPKTKILKDEIKPNYPLIIKSRFGAGSKSIFIAENKEDFSYFKSKYPHYLSQEYISSIDQEYTCGLFQSGNSEFRNIIIHRRLMDGGQTGFGEIIENEEIENLLIGLAKTLKLRGSINVQLRMSKRGPIIFEINPRFSSTILFRHLLGFEDLIWSIYDKFNQPINSYIAPPINSKFYKGFSEYVTIN